MFRDSFGPFHRLASALLVLSACTVSPVGAEQSLRRVPGLTLSEHGEVLRESNRVELPRDDFFSAVLQASTLRKRRTGTRRHLELDTVVVNFSTLAEAGGIPLEPYRSRSGKGYVGVSGRLRTSDDMPNLRFSVGEECAEPFAAFSSPHEDYSWSVVVPIEQFSVGFQSGDDSLFGYFAIGGVQWTSSDDTLAAGMGIPFQLRNADGDAGLLFVVRMKLP